MPEWWPEEIEAMRNPDPRALPPHLREEGEQEAEEETQEEGNE
jgi:hypothetical protein